MKTLIAFYSKTGNTKKIAEDLAKRLKADLDEIIDLTDRSGIKGWLFGGRDSMKEFSTEIKTTKNPKDYDLIIIGTPVWAWKATPAVVTYLKQFKDQIKKVIFFSTSSSTDPQKTVSYLEGFLNKKAICFSGWTESEVKTNHYQSKLDQFIDEIKKV